MILVKRCCVWHTSSRFPPANTEPSITSIGLLRTERSASSHLSTCQGLSALPSVDMSERSASHLSTCQGLSALPSVYNSRTERLGSHLSGLSRTERSASHLSGPSRTERSASHLSTCQGLSALHSIYRLVKD